MPEQLTPEPLTPEPLTRKLLTIEGLSVSFPDEDRWVPVVREVSFSIGKGELVGLVGESGSGKSVTALALMNLVPTPGRINSGRILLEGADILSLPEPRMRRLRGARIGMIFQEPMTALNPVYSVGFQLVEAIRAHRPMSRTEARREAVRLLEVASLAGAKERLDDYPHQLSGGQRQRVMIAMSLAGEPDLLLADEPTTALDVTIQAQILELLERLRQDLGLAVLLITHDLAVVAETCDRVLVMYAGQVVERASAEALFRHPGHPYTRGLLSALPKLGRRIARGALPAIPGQVPDPGNLPAGCPFHPRCPDRFAPCDGGQPELYALSAEQEARCFLHRGAPSGEPTGEAEPRGVQP